MSRSCKINQTKRQLGGSSKNIREYTDKANNKLWKVVCLRFVLRLEIFKSEDYTREYKYIYKDNETKTKENQNKTKEIIKNEAANKKFCERQPIEIREKTSPLLFKFKLKQCFFFMILQIFVKCIQFDGDKAIQFIIIIISYKKLTINFC